MTNHSHRRNSRNTSTVGASFGKTGKKSSSVKPAVKSVEKKNPLPKKSAAKSKSKITGASAKRALKKKKQPVRPEKKPFASK